MPFKYKKDRQNYDKLYRKKHFKRRKKLLALYYKKHKEYRVKNRATLSLKQKKYYLKNKKRLRVWYNNYYKIKRLTDPSYKILCNLRRRLGFAIRHYKKIDQTLVLLECTVSYLKQYLTKKFKKDMNWENYGRGKGKWQIDHIRPCSSFNFALSADQKACFHYTNLQPLWWYENIQKGNKL